MISQLHMGLLHIDNVPVGGARNPEIERASYDTAV